MWNSTREYEACVLVNGRPITEVHHASKTYVEGRNGSVFELQFRNNTSQRALVVISVDGLDVIEGKRAGKRSQGYVVGPHQVAKIPGWKLSDRGAARFEFGIQDADYAEDETYVDQMGHDPANQGMIGFMVFREKARVPFIGSVQTFSAPNRGPFDIEQSGYGVRGMRNGGPTLDSLRGVADVGSFSAGSMTRGGGSTWSASGSSSYTGASLGSAKGLVDADVEADDKGLGTKFGEETRFETGTTYFDREAEPVSVMVFHYDTIRRLKDLGVPVERFRPNRRPRRESGTPFPCSPELYESDGCPRPDGYRRRRHGRRRYRA